MLVGAHAGSLSALPASFLEGLKCGLPRVFQKVLRGQSERHKKGREEMKDTGL